MTIEMTRPELTRTARVGVQFTEGVSAWPADPTVNPAAVTAKTEVAPGAIRVGTQRGWLTLNAPSDGTRKLLTSLANGPVSETDLAATVVAADGESGLMGMHMLLARLGGSGLLQHTLEVDGRLFATLRVIGSGGIRLPGRLPVDTAVKLSRFATITVDGGALVVRAPRSPLAVELTAVGAAILGPLADWNSTAELVDVLPELPVAALENVLKFLTAAGVLAAGDAANDVELSRADLAQWSPADLALHTRTRGPRSVPGYGGTYRGLGTRDPEPIQPERFSGRTVTLKVPDLAALMESDTGLTQVLESRHSTRVHDDNNPITLDQLAELLYRTVRLRQFYPSANGETAADRPYPSGGATHELEIYPLISNCAGIEAGLWHYRTDDHTLELVSEPDKTTASLVNQAKASSLMPGDPQIVLLISARFGRVMFKYETIPYALILKHVGVLYQTLYLVGTAMGLGVCGLGGGDAEGFAAATGRGYFTEGSVGELVIGSPGTQSQGTQTAVGFPATTGAALASTASTSTASTSTASTSTASTNPASTSTAPAGSAPSGEGPSS